jgi:hypothetical protein
VDTRGVDALAISDAVRNAERRSLHLADGSNGVRCA